ncbi:TRANSCRIPTIONAL REGULATORY protein [Enhygromyxa salina]|uniref:TRANSCRIPTIONAL REGULATORY protein n=1 Tax=Enhygromyxa salina TaxID=215803 RepID=A0A0C1ZQ85_9BACT|nr:TRANSCRIPTIONAL REGULATORY protein [Enhygromyxa salina]
MLACDSGRVDVVLGERCHCTCATTREHSNDHRNQHLLDPKTPLDPERVAAVSNDEKRTEDP